MTTEAVKAVESGLEKIEAKLDKSLEKFQGQIDESGKASNDIRDEVKAVAEQHEKMNAKLIDLQQNMTKGFDEGRELPKSIGAQFTESDAFKSYAAGGTQKARVEVKNTIIGETGGNPSGVLTQADRLAGIVPGAFRALRLMDVLPSGSTVSNNIEYTRELAYTNAAAETSEGNQKPESTLTFELANAPVRTIAHIIKVSKQALEDAPALQSYIDRRMTHGVRNRVEQQVINGDGTTPNLSGIFTAGNHAAFTPTAGDTAIDSLNRAKYAVIAADYSADVLLMNPADWGAIERLKKGDLGYVGGEGAGITYLMNGMQPVIWGLPVVASNNIPEGQFAAVSMEALQVMNRSGVVIEMFEQDADNVQKNLLTIRAEARLALPIYTPAAIQVGALTAA